MLCDLVFAPVKSEGLEPLENMKLFELSFWPLLVCLSDGKGPAPSGRETTKGGSHDMGFSPGVGGWFTVTAPSVVSMSANGFFAE